LNQNEYSITAPSVIPFELGTGTSKQITVKFSPGSIGVKNAELTFPNNSKNFAPIIPTNFYENEIKIYYSENKNSSMQLRDFKILVVIFFATFFTFQTHAQFVAGKIVDEKNEPVPYATIFVAETKEGTISNSEGNYKIQLPHGVYHFTIRSLGYVQLINEVNNFKSDTTILNIILQKQSFEIKEIMILPGKEDPAWYIMRKAIAKAPLYRQKIKHYEADLYIKSNFTFTSIPRVYQNKIEIEGRKLKELIKENVTYVIESQNRITFDYPNKYEKKVISKKTSLTGLDEPPVM